MSDEVNELKLLLKDLNTVISVNEKELEGKLDEVQFLKDMIVWDKDIRKEVDKVNARLTGLYLKVAGASGAIVGIIELIANA